MSEVEIETKATERMTQEVAESVATYTWRERVIVKAPLYIIFVLVWEAGDVEVGANVMREVKVFEFNPALDERTKHILYIPHCEVIVGEVERFERLSSQESRSKTHHKPLRLVLL